MEEFKTRPLKSWLLENVNGRMGLIKTYDKMVIFFEDSNDAILFRLKDGAEAWREDSTSF